jgi:hypothetical protein
MVWVVVVVGETMVEQSERVVVEHLPVLRRVLSRLVV